MMMDAMRRVRLLIASVAIKTARKTVSDVLDAETFPRHERAIDPEEAILVECWQALGEAEKVILRRYDAAVSKALEETSAEAVPA